MIEAQAEYFAYLAHVGEAREVDGAVAVKTGAQSNTENGVVARGAADVAALVDWLERLPASWLDLGGLNRDALLAAGARPERSGWMISGLVADVELAPRAEVQVVRDLERWFALAGPDLATLRPVYERLAALPDGRVRFYVAEDAGYASAFFGKRTALFTHVGVLEPERRRGIATALVAARLRDAREHGCERFVLGPSHDGAELYRALGLEAQPEPPDRWYYLPCG